MYKILFITGSMNQTLQMHRIASQLPEYDCWFSQLFSDSPLVKFLLKRSSLLNGIILADQFRRNSENYLREHKLQIDYGALLNHYDLVVYCSDLLVTKRITATKTIWVQEGMVDRYTWASSLVKSLKLPPSLCGNTSLNGSSNICDIYCAASEGYKQYFGSKGTDAERIIVTGMPNYDDLERYRNNNFPYRDYVMVATTDMRETMRYEDRPKFIKQAAKLAAGRQMLFKLHPNENMERAEQEIRKYAPTDTLVYRSGNTNEMIANCCELITQYSTVVYTGIALGKKVHSWFNVDELKRLTPLQNGGTSAKNIANICRDYLNHDGDLKGFLSNYQYKPAPINVKEELVLA